MLCVAMIDMDIILIFACTPYLYLHVACLFLARAARGGGRRVSSGAAKTASGSVRSRAMRDGESRPNHLQSHSPAQGLPLAARILR